ncbi:MAG: ChuX/HutX family heme-like substrate-binding protein [Pseudomonadota bacterium]
MSLTANQQMPSSGNLAEVWQSFRDDNPKVRIRDAAQALGVSEAELIATRCGDGVTRLRGDWGTLIKSVATIGEVMALTRNDNAVHEKIGVYNNVRIMGKMGLVLDKEIDLRIFLSQWHHAFSVTEDTKSGERHSLQFFNASGAAIHKIYLTDGSDFAVYKEIVEQYISDNQSTDIEVTAKPTAEVEIADSEVDVEAFRSEWRGLQDTHDFFDLQNRYKLSRTQALRLGGSEFARQTDPELFEEFMQSLADACQSIMIFVGNKGMIQIHTGPVCKLKRVGPWFNVLDERFNLHLRDDAIDSAWVVRKPTVDGDVTSLELFDVDGEVIAYIFGERKPGLAELPEWRQMVNALPTIEQTA